MNLVEIAQAAEVVKPDDQSTTRFAPYVSMPPAVRDALVAAVLAAQQFRSVFFVDDHEYGSRARETYQAVTALDQALEGLR